MFEKDCSLDSGHFCEDVSVFDDTSQKNAFYIESVRLCSEAGPKNKAQDVEETFYSQHMTLPIGNLAQLNGVSVYLNLSKYICLNLREYDSRNELVWTPFTI